MSTKPFGILDPLKYALRALAPLWKLAASFVSLLICAEVLGGLAILIGDMIVSNSPFSIVFSVYKKVALDYQKMISFEVDHHAWLNPLIQFWPITLCAGTIFITVLIWVEVGLVEAALQWHDTGKASIKTLLSKSYKTVFTLVWVVLLVVILFVFFALLLHYLPLLYFGKEREDLFHTIKALSELYIYFRCSFIAIYIIDKKSSVIDAIKHSHYHICWQGQLFEAYFFVYLFDIGAGFIPFLGRPIGIWAICFAETYMYRKLVPFNVSIKDEGLGVVQ